MVGKIGEKAEETIPPEDAAGRDGPGRGQSALRGGNRAVPKVS